MIKKDWQEALKEMDKLHAIAVKNVILAQRQVEELEFNIANYERKIKEF